MKYVQEDNHTGRFVDKLRTNKVFILLNNLQVLKGILYRTNSCGPSIFFFILYTFIHNVLINDIKESVRGQLVQPFRLSKHSTLHHVQSYLVLEQTKLFTHSIYLFLIHPPNSDHDHPIVTTPALLMSVEHLHATTYNA